MSTIEDCSSCNRTFKCVGSTDASNECAFCSSLYCNDCVGIAGENSACPPPGGKPDYVATKAVSVCYTTGLTLNKCTCEVKPCVKARMLFLCTGCAHGSIIDDPLPSMTTSVGFGGSFYRWLLRQFNVNVKWELFDRFRDEYASQHRVVGLFKRNIVVNVETGYVTMTRFNPVSKFLKRMALTKVAAVSDEDKGAGDVDYHNIQDGDDDDVNIVSDIDSDEEDKVVEKKEKVVIRKSLPNKASFAKRKASSIITVDCTSCNVKFDREVNSNSTYECASCESEFCLDCIKTADKSTAKPAAVSTPNWVMEPVFEVCEKSFIVVGRCTCMCREDCQCGDCECDRKRPCKNKTNIFLCYHCVNGDIFDYHLPSLSETSGFSPKFYEWMYKTLNVQGKVDLFTAFKAYYTAKYKVHKVNTRKLIVHPTSGYIQLRRNDPTGPTYIMLSNDDFVDDEHKVKDHDDSDDDEGSACESEEDDDIVPSSLSSSSLIKGPWSSSDEATLIRLKSEGMSTNDIAATFRRTVTSIYRKWYRINPKQNVEAEEEDDDDDIQCSQDY
jgi:hypothetical protein